MKVPDAGEPCHHRPICFINFIRYLQKVAATLPEPQLVSVWPREQLRHIVRFQFAWNIRWQHNCYIRNLAFFGIIDPSACSYDMGVSREMKS